MKKKCKCGHRKVMHGPNVFTGFDSCRAILPGHGSTRDNQIGIEYGGRRDGWCPCQSFIEVKK
jgi:hypothetical protein